MGTGNTDGVRSLDITTPVIQQGLPEQSQLLFDPEDPWETFYNVFRGCSARSAVWIANAVCPVLLNGHVHCGAGKRRLKQWADVRLRSLCSGIAENTHVLGKIDRPEGF